MKHALAVLAGIATGLPVMAALASAAGHTAGGLPDRYVPWAQHRLGGGYAAIRTPVRAAHRRTVRRSRMPVAALAAATPSPVPRPVHRAAPGDGLRVSIAAPRTVRPGGTYTYRVRLANRGPGTPDDITVRNVLPSGVERTGSSLPGGAGGYAGGRDTTLVLPRLAPGRSATARFVVRVRPTTRGELVARSRVAYVDGARMPAGPAARVATRVR